MRLSRKGEHDNRKGKMERKGKDREKAGGKGDE